MSRCTGQCCDMLLLGGPPAAVAARVERTRLRVVADDPRLAEWEQVAAMMEYLGEVENPERPGAPPDHWYRCRHFDRETRDCRIYETRPPMCRAFPNGRPCPNVGCTMGEGAP